MRLNKKKREEEEIKQELAVPQKKDGIYLICGLISLAIAVYTLIAIISYVFTWAQDQSTFSNDDVFNSLIDVENGGGKIGLYWANFLVSKLFGLGAFIIPFFFFGIALFCLKIKKVKVVRLFFVTMFGCILISVVFSFIFSFTGIDRWFGTGAGGSYGYYINNWLKSMVGIPGTSVILIIATIGWLITINRSYIKRIGDKISDVGTKVVDTAKAPFESNPDSPEQSEEENGDGGDADAEEDIEDGGEDESEIEEAEVDDAAVGVKANGGRPEPEISLVDNTVKPAVSFAAASANEVIEKQSILEPEIKGTDNVEMEVTGGNDAGLTGHYSEEELKTLFDPRLELPRYKAPSLDLLETYKNKWYEVSKDELERNKRQIVNTLSNYKIGITKISVRIGPTVTLYEIVPAPGVRVSQIKKLEEDIQLSLAAHGVRVVTLPGTNAVGIEVANEKPSIVSMLSCLEFLLAQRKIEETKEARYELPVAIGKTIKNEVYTFDLTKMPHLLIAGATGQGKSVGLNAVIASILYTKHPSEVKFVLVDPKRVELSLYSKLEKFFLAKLPDSDDAVITDTKKVVYTLRSLCSEMDSRYELLQKAGVRNIKEYNEKFLQRRLNPLKGHRYLPYIVVVIDEYGDLLLTAGKDIEIPLTRLAQLARATGIHLVIATQRPTTTIITGNIKANFPARIAFMVRSSIDSRTILDETGANQLIGRGDMLFATGSDVVRIQCALIDTKEVEKVVDFISGQVGYASALYLPEVQEDNDDDGGGQASVQVGETDLRKRDELFDDTARLMVISGQASASLIQRKMNLGYNRASRIIDQLERAGIVGPADGSKPRQVLVPDLISLDDKLEEIKKEYS
ncbi:MAG TPA: DNA translocase FtsK 4TM domain-containing protein [Candidatus Egerieousia sp.]|nr:DNA translocase FtsK 4TM domain-containing protein [Candidatus Egerieousia sp.]HPT05615.1 DNA translocase FtsK 4TM domain-containing protein [Candidatus Egerieousia sp.]